MDPAAENSKLIHDYLKGARALEWNKYTLGEIGSRLWETLSGYAAQKESAEARIKAIEDTVSGLKKRLEASRQPKKTETAVPGKRMDLNFMLQTYVVIAIIVTFLTMLSGWLGEKTGFRLLMIPFEFGAKLVDKFGFFPGVVMHYLLIPLVISAVVLLVISLIRRNKPDEQPAQAPPREEEPEEEAALRAELEAEINGNLEEIKKLRDEVDLQDTLIARAQSDIDANDKALVKSDEALRKYYEANVLPEKYRGRISVTMMEDLFGSERCSTLSGFEGALNLYDLDADTAQESSAVAAALAEADSNVEYLMGSLQNNSQMPRYYQYSDNLTERLLEHIASMGYAEKHLT